MTSTLRKAFSIPGESVPMTDQHPSTAKRVLFFDQIKALMIALVIAVHVFLAFLGDWLGVHIAMSSSPHPLFVGVAVWVMSFSNTFYVHAVSALGLSLQDRLL